MCLDLDITPVNKQYFCLSGPPDIAAFKWVSPAITTTLRALTLTLTLTQNTRT